MPKKKNKEVGRPVRREEDNIEELQVKIDEYFEWCDNHIKITKNLFYDEDMEKYEERMRVRQNLSDKQRETRHEPTEPVKETKKQISSPPTVTGLANYIGCTRETLCQYEKKEEFSDTIKRAKSRVEEFCEIRLHTANSATGPIFALKNFGWKDKIEVDNNTTITEKKVTEKQQKAIDSLLKKAGKK